MTVDNTTDQTLALEPEGRSSLVVMHTFINFCITLWNCVGGGGHGGGPSPAPEINANGAIAALALLLSVAIVVYQRRKADSR